MTQLKMPPGKPGRFKQVIRYDLLGQRVEEFEHRRAVAGGISKGD